MSSKQKIDKNGFTILEVMIVLAVTMIIFFMATVFISGKQNYAAFTVSVSNLQSQLNQIQNNVVNGSYSSQSFSCTGNAPNPPALTQGSNSIGSHYGCIFLGDVIHFSQNHFAIYPLIGNQFEPNSIEPINGISDSNIGAEVSSYGNPIFPTVENYQSGLQLTCMNYFISNKLPPNCDTSSSQNNNSLIFYFNTISSNSSQQLSYYPILLTGLNISEINYTNQIDTNNNIRNSLINDAFSASGKVYVGELLCFSSGGTNNSALFKIGGYNLSNSISYKIYTNRNCT